MADTKIVNFAGLVVVFGIVFVLLVAPYLVMAWHNPAPDRSSVMLVNVVFPPGLYKVELVWGDVLREETFESDGGPLVVRLDVDRVNLRRPIFIKITRSGVTVVEMTLRPSPFGYEVESLKIDPHVRFMDLSRAVYISELVTTANATVKWSTNKTVSIRNILVNGLRPLSVDVSKDSVRVLDFVVDERVVLEVEFDEGWIEAEFKLTTEGLHASSRFSGPFNSATVEYYYSLKRVSWYIALPITREENSTILVQDYGYIESGRSSNPYALRPQIPHEASTSQIINESQPQTPQEESDRTPPVLDALRRFRSELLMIGGLIVLAGLIKRKLLIAIMGATLIALLLVLA
ncbi:MAG: hypothetical protein QXW41_08325 [Fervidicoccaceae archaeon]